MLANLIILITIGLLAAAYIFYKVRKSLNKSTCDCCSGCSKSTDKSCSANCGNR